MTNNINSPKYIILFYDMKYKNYMVRLVNNSYDTIKLISTLGPICSIEDLYVKVITITSLSYIDSDLCINDKIVMGDKDIYIKINTKDIKNISYFLCSVTDFENSLK